MQETSSTTVVKMPRESQDNMAINFMDLRLESKHDSSNSRSLKRQNRRDHESKHAGPSLTAPNMDEVLCIGYGGSEEDNYFDDVVGALEEIIMDPQFNQLQSKFCLRYCEQFVDSEENRLEYTDIFNKYTNCIEGYLHDRLSSTIKDFDMDVFVRMCEERRDEIVGDVFDILFSCTDFEEFKSLMLSYKAELNGSAPYLAFKP